MNILFNTVLFYPFHYLKYSFFIQYLPHMQYIHFCLSQPHMRCVCHPHFSGKETEGRRVHTTSNETAGIWAVYALKPSTIWTWTPALSFTVCTTLEFTGALSYHTVFLCWHLSLETPHCLSVRKTPVYPSSVNSHPGFLIPLSLAWRLVLLYPLWVSVAHTLVKVMYISLSARLWTAQEQELPKT